MTLHFPSRFVWFIIALVIFTLLQSGCQPIQPPTPPLLNPTTTTDDLAGWSSYNVVAESVSPDEQWTAMTLFQEPSNQERSDSDKYYQGLVVTHASGIPSYTLVNGWLPWGLGYTLPIPVYWSQDGERFYYTNRPHSDGCGLLVNSSDLYRVDLHTGETTELLPANTSSWLAISPDEQRIAYFKPGEPTLVIQELNGDKVIPINIASLLEDGQAGSIVWSPDSNAIAFVIAHKPCAGGWAESTSIYVVDLHDIDSIEQPKIITHLQNDDRLLMPVAWPSDNTLIVENQVPFDRLDEKRQFTFDLATHTVSPVEGQ